MRHILTFKTAFPESSEYKHPRGHSVCRFLQEELSRSGFEVDESENYRDIAWSVDCRIASKRVFFFVGYLGTKMADWQLIVCSGRSIFARLIRRNDQNERIRLARAIHKVLRSDPRFGDLKWYAKYTNTEKDEWHRTPT